MLVNCLCRESKPKAPGLSSHALQLLQQQDNHHPTQSSICAAQVELNTLVIYTQQLLSIIMQSDHKLKACRSSGTRVELFSPCNKII